MGIVDLVWHPRFSRIERLQQGYYRLILRHLDDQVVEVCGSMEYVAAEGLERLKEIDMALVDRVRKLCGNVLTQVNAD